MIPLIYKYLNNCSSGKYKFWMSSAKGKSLWNVMQCVQEELCLVWVKTGERMICFHIQFNNWLEVNIVFMSPVAGYTMP